MGVEPLGVGPGRGVAMDVGGAIEGQGHWGGVQRGLLPDPVP